MKALTYFILIAFMLTLGCGYAWEQYGDDEEDSGDGGDQIPTGEKIQDFTWTTWDGQELTLYNYEGYVIILTVGAGWCQGCKQETPILQSEFYEVYKDQDFIVIQLLVEDDEFNPADTADATDWRSEFGLSYPVCIDPNWSLQEYFLEDTLPFTMLLDRNLYIVKTAHEFDKEAYKLEVEELL